MRKKSSNKRDLIIAKAQELFFMKGYSKTSVNMIIEALKISKGAFYHYFKSKQDLLDSLTDQFHIEMLNTLQVIISDPEIDGVQKLNLVLKQAIQYKSDNLEFIIAYINAYYSDDNVLMRSKMQQKANEIGIQIYQQIFAQALTEGSIEITDSYATAQIIILLGAGIANASSEIFRTCETKPDELDRLFPLFEAYQQAIERILGLSPGTIDPFDLSILEQLKIYYQARDQ